MGFEVCLLGIEDIGFFMIQTTYSFSKVQGQSIVIFRGLGRYYSDFPGSRELENRFSEVQGTSISILIGLGS